MHRVIRRARTICLWALVTLAAADSAAADNGFFPFWAEPFARTLCTQDELTSEVVATQAYVHGLAGWRLETMEQEAGLYRGVLRPEDGSVLEVIGRLHGTSQQRLRLVHVAGDDYEFADFFLQMAPDCSVNLGRVVLRGPDGAPYQLLHFSANLSRITETEALNPPVPEGTDPGGVAVAHVDSGVNYALPEISQRLARDEKGKSLGYDFFDDDNRPFDLKPSRMAFFPLRHGTAVASVLIAEAPKVRLIPLRHPARGFDRYADIVEHIAKGPARIVLMPLGGYKRDDWKVFTDAAAKHPELLFILTAGNNGRDIDAEPVYPASLKLENAIVVTSSDGFGKLAEDANWGPETVDIAVPAERIEVIDHRGAKGRASGASYAAPRIAALAARLLSLNPEWTPVELKKAILDFASPMPRESEPRTRHGWIVNPALEAVVE
ncbi:MAG: S8 family serine peptidase [Hyphomicrobiales bacterium]